MSLEGFAAGPHDGVDEPMGVGGFRLFNWLYRRHEPDENGQVFNEAMATRAVVAGRRTYENAGRWQGDHHDGVPISSSSCTSCPFCSDAAAGSSTKLPGEPVELELVRCLTPDARNREQQVTHLRYRVMH